MPFLERSFVPNDILELPNDLLIIFIGHVIQYLVVGEDIFICIIVHRTSELDIGRGVINMVLVVFDCFHNADLAGLTIFLCDPKSAPNKIFRVNNWHLWPSTIIILTNCTIYM